MNVTILSGRLTADPELTYTAQGTAIAKMRIAVKNPFRKVDGKATADFFDVTCWRQTAEFVSNYVGKGREVILRGRLEESRWETQDGQKRSRVIVNADEVESVGPNPNSENQTHKVDHAAGDGAQAGEGDDMFSGEV